MLLKNQKLNFMKKNNLILFSILCLLITSCEEEKHKYPLDKRYWDINDYNEIVRHLRFGYENDEKLPSFDNPETRLIVEKLIDEQNYKVVLDDNELGIKHRNNLGEKFFKEWRYMTEVYTATNRKDQYLYDKEMLAVWHFGLGLQLKYFKLGNDQIKANADDPNSKSVNNNINSNVKTLIKNYIIYLDEINNQNAFSSAGKIKLAKGIDIYFSQLINLYPNANYSGMKDKAQLMLKKSKSNEITLALTKLIQLIESKQTEIQK